MRAHVRTSQAKQNRYERFLLRKTQRQFARRLIYDGAYFDLESKEKVNQVREVEVRGALRDKFKGLPLFISHTWYLVKGEVIEDPYGEGSFQTGLGP